MYKKDIYFYVAILVIAFSHALSDYEKLKIFEGLGSTLKFCALEAEVTDLQVQQARKTKNISAVSACFFNCVLNETNLITTVLGKKAINTPQSLKLLKSVGPILGIVNMRPLTTELLNCGLEYYKAPDNDDYPVCAKTSVLVDCLAKAPTVSSTISLIVNLIFI